MTKGVLKILFKTYNNIFVLTGILMLLLAGVIYLVLGKQAADSLTGQMLSREQVAAKAGAISVKAFVQNLGYQVAAFSVRDTVESFDPQYAQRDIESFLNSWQGTPVSGLVLVGADGIVKYGADRAGSVGKGVSVSDRAYFNWAKTAKPGSVFIGDPIKSKIGFASARYIVPVAAPIIKNGQFNGVLTVSFLLDEATTIFLNPLKISDNTKIYLIEDNGIILSSPIQKLIGVNYLDYVTKSGIPGGAGINQALNSALKAGNDGKIDIALPDDNKNGALTRYLVAFSSIIVGNQHWVLAVATPAGDTLAYLTPYYFSYLAIVALALLAFLIIAIRISKIKAYQEAAEEEHKIHGIKTPQNF